MLILIQPSRQPGVSGLLLTLLAVGLLILAGPGRAMAARGSVPSGDEQQQRIDQAVNRALVWLSNEQHPSGAWSTRNFGESTATTSLAILSFMAAGHIPDEGPYGNQITRGIAWVLAQQQPNGLLVGRKASHGPMYSHGITTLMLAEVAGMVRPDQRQPVREALVRAVKLIISAQNQPRPEQHEGGWRYQPASTASDLSVTAWQLLALRAAKDIGCDVPAANIRRAIAYIKGLAVRRGGGFGYMTASGATITRAGTGIVALEVCGEHRSPEVMAAAGMILSRPLTSGEHYFYYGAYYCTVGMYKVGGDEWRQARPVLYETILEQQSPAGFWNVTGGAELGAGTVYTTSMSILALTIEYGYLPIYQR